MIQALAIAQALKIPTFVIFDSDGNEADEEKRSMHERDNHALLSLSSCGTSDPLPKTTFWGPNVAMWHSNIGLVVEEDIGKAEWQKYNDRADQQYGQAGSLGKNMLHIGAALALASDDGKQSSHLDRLCQEILKFGRS